MVRAAIERRVRQVGLVPHKDVIFVDETSFDASVVDEGLLAVGVYFGSDGSDDAAAIAAQALLQRGAFVIPVVADLARFSSLVPATLQGINGDAPGDGDELPQRVASRIVERYPFTC
jgi:hypothetical protein